MWIIGDDLMSRSYAEHFQNAFMMDEIAENCNLGYIKAHYDCTPFCNGSVGKRLANSNIIGRIQNEFVAINDRVIMPKLVLIVLESDLLQAADHFTDGISQLLGEMIDWMAMQLHRISVAHKEKLPTKARKFRYPHFLWIAASHHSGFQDNFYQRKFNTCLISVIDKFQEMSILMLHTLDSQDRTLVADGKFTNAGLNKFWSAVDAAVQKWD